MTGQHGPVILAFRASEPAADVLDLAPGSFLRVPAARSHPRRTPIGRTDRATGPRRASKSKWVWSGVDLPAHSHKARLWKSCCVARQGHWARQFEGQLRTVWLPPCHCVPLTTASRGVSRSATVDRVSSFEPLNWESVRIKRIGRVGFESRSAQISLAPQPDNGKNYSPNSASPILFAASRCIVGVTWL